MKNFLISLSVFLVLSFSLCVFVSADDINSLEGTSWTINENFSTSVNSNFRIVFESMGNSYDNIDISYGTIYYASGTNRTLVANNALPDEHWLIPEARVITIVSGRDLSNASLINWLSNNATIYIPPSDPLDDLNVSSGVSASIGWFGSVLTDVVSSPYVLPLVGLAVAFFVIIPYGIIIIKKLLKGY